MHRRRARNLNIKPRLELVVIAAYHAVMGAALMSKIRGNQESRQREYASERRYMDVADFNAVERGYGYDLGLLGRAAFSGFILVAAAGECGAAGGI